MALERRRHPIFRKSITVTSTIGAVVLVLTFLAVLSIAAFQPRFCGTCHSQIYKTWSTSTHKHVSCSDCHVKPDLKSIILSRLGLTKTILMKITFLRDRERPDGFSGHPPNELCDHCHKVKRAVSPSGDLRIPHSAHTKLRKLSCIDCHRGLVHKKSSIKRSRTSMIGCYRCHDGKKAPNSCSICHTEKSLPDDHRSPDWLNIHSQVQRADPDYCVRCHGWVKDYCNECHQRKPRSHLTGWPGWRAKHQVYILSDEKRGCSQCHGEVCVSCHPR